jgi:hypothetical protein
MRSRSGGCGIEEWGGGGNFGVRVMSTREKKMTLPPDERAWTAARKEKNGPVRTFQGAGGPAGGNRTAGANRALTWSIFPLSIMK